MDTPFNDFTIAMYSVKVKWDCPPTDVFMKKDFDGDNINTMIVMCNGVSGIEESIQQSHYAAKMECGFSVLKHEKMYTGHICIQKKLFDASYLSNLQ